jgi:hypothetical protein
MKLHYHANEERVHVMDGAAIILPSRLAPTSQQTKVHCWLMVSSFSAHTSPGGANAHVRWARARATWLELPVATKRELRRRKPLLQTLRIVSLFYSPLWPQLAMPKRDERFLPTQTADDFGETQNSLMKFTSVRKTLRFFANTCRFGLPLQVLL